jgi:hypothetical protein
VRPGRPTQAGRSAHRRTVGHQEKGDNVVRRLLTRLRGDAGMNTAEYAVGTLAAVAFAGILLKVLTSESVQAALTGVIDRALN